MKSDTLDLVFTALAHPTRRQIIDFLMNAPGASLTTITSQFDISRIAIMKHLAALEAAGLVLSEKHGRVRHHYFNPVPIQQIHERWTTTYSQFWSDRVLDIKRNVEGRKRGKKHA